MEPVIITAAVTGSAPTREMNPAVPYTPEEIAEAAVQCHAAGAAIAHIHVREPDSGRPAFRIELFEEVLTRIRRRCDMIVNLTTSGLNLEGPHATRRRLHARSGRQTGKQCRNGVRGRRPCDPAGPAGGHGRAGPGHAQNRAALVTMNGFRKAQHTCRRRAFSKAARRRRPRAQAGSGSLRIYISVGVDGL